MSVDLARIQRIHSLEGEIAAADLELRAIKDRRTELVIAQYSTGHLPVLPVVPPDPGRSPYRRTFRCHHAWRIQREPAAHKEAPAQF